MTNKTPGEDFFNALVREAHQNPNIQSILKHSLSRPLGLDTRAIQIIDTLLPANTSKYRRKCYFLAAALWAHSDQFPEAFGLPIGVKFAKFRSTSFDRRFGAFLESPVEYTKSHLLSLLSITKGGKSVNYAQLLDDFFVWKTRKPQAKIARDYYTSNNN